MNFSLPYSGHILVIQRIEKLHFYLPYNINSGSLVMVYSGIMIPVLKHLDLNRLDRTNSKSLKTNNPTTCMFSQWT